MRRKAVVTLILPSRQHRKQAPSGSLAALKTFPASHHLAAFFLGSISLLFGLCGRAEDFPLRQAAEARFDLYAVANVASLDGGELVGGLGTVTRPSWMKPADQARSYSVTFPVATFGSNEVTLRFTPQASGRVTLSLLGAYDRPLGGKDGIYKQEVIWDLIQTTGGSLVGESGALLQLPVRSWLRQRYELGLQVTGLMPVTLRLAARAAEVPGEARMKPINIRTDANGGGLEGFQKGVRILRGTELLRSDLNEREFSERDFVTMADEGFDHIRVSIPWPQACGPAPDYAVDRNVLGRVDLLANWAWKAGLGFVLGCQRTSDPSVDPAREAARFASFWGSMATRYSNAPNSKLAFELLQPGGEKGSTFALNALYSDALKSIRNMSQTRWVFVTVGRGGNPGELDRLRLPESDDHIVVALQSREPELFTQQATMGLRTHGVPAIRFPGPPVEPLRLSAESTLDPTLRESLRRYEVKPSSENPSGVSGLQAWVEFAARWSSHYGRPITFVDIGCSRALESGSRARYYTAWREVLALHHVPWSVVDWKQEQRYWDPAQQRPMPGLREALFPGRKPVVSEKIAKEATLAMSHPQISEVPGTNTHASRTTVSSVSPQMTWAKAMSELQERSDWNWRLTRWTLSAMLGISLVILLLSVFRNRPAVEIVTTTHILARRGFDSGDESVTLGRVTQLLKEKLVLHLLASRRAGQLVQQQAADEVADMERRLEQLHAPLQEKLQTYERRIAELERDLSKMGEQNRDLIRAKIEMTKQRITAPPRAVRPEELN